MAVRCFLVILLLLAAACESDAPKIELYDGYYYGMSYKDVRARSLAVECDNSLDSLCRPTPVPFFKVSWYQRFNFRSDRLLSIDLISLEPKKTSPLINGWLDSGYRFVPVLMTSGGKQLDIYAAMVREGKEGARRAVHAFLRSTAQDLENTYLYIDFQDHEEQLKGLHSYQAILNYAPRDILGVEQTVNDTECILTFRAPIAEWQDKGAPKAK
ncbi:MAG: hypothetical protein IJU76_13485 [Desulfovibrionaceae bacterium]|nr:hypothetical protein [Desulfovibrionaceae bacterium]